MIIGVVGTADDKNLVGIRGNGKTATLTKNLYTRYLQGWTVYTNFYTTFSTMKTMQEIFELVIYEDLRDVAIGIQEIQVAANSIGVSAEQVRFMDMVAGQTRKRNTEVWYDSQRLMNVNKRLRVQTDTILMPYKIHLDGTLCARDSCNLPHIIVVTSYQPYIERPIDAFLAADVGMLYDTNEITIERWVTEKEKKRREKAVS